MSPTVRIAADALDAAMARLAPAGTALAAILGRNPAGEVACCALDAPTTWSAAFVGHALAVATFAPPPRVTRACAQTAVDIVPAAMPVPAVQAIARMPGRRQRRATRGRSSRAKHGGNSRAA